MKLIQNKDELERGRQYYVRLKEPDYLGQDLNDTIEIVQTVASTDKEDNPPVLLKFEHHNVRVTPNQSFKVFDFIGPIPIVDRPDFDEYLKKEKQDEANT